MKIGSLELIHNFGKNIKKTISVPGGESLMLAQGGSYLWVGPDPISRYQGWFFGFGNNKLIKILDGVRIENAGGVVAVENNFWSAKTVRENNSETFWLPGNDCLVFETEKQAKMEFFLDIKNPYQNQEFGRNYRVWHEDSFLFISHSQDNGCGLPEVFVAVCGDMAEVEIKNAWVRRDYSFDRKRRSEPSARWVFSPAIISASKLVFAAGFTKEEAKTAVGKLWRDFEIMKRKKQTDFEKQIRDESRTKAISFFTRKEAPNENNAAGHCARNSLKMLFSVQNGAAALRAGLPWFFQIWQRDEAVSLRGLGQFEQKTAFDIFWRQLEELRTGNFHSDTADGIGWLFLRAADFYRSGKFNTKEAAAVAECLEKSIAYLLENCTNNDLAVGAGKTWMDSLDRAGAQIEIQALRLSMYALAGDLAADKKEKERYLKLENNLKMAARQLFFDGTRLADLFDTNRGRADFTVRPNIFLAAYVYPGLLSKSEWTLCFEHALGKLWLEWGGLATIDKNDSKFCNDDSGENPTAYHNGDSWFWVNNIAAVAMARVDGKRFKNYIGKIFNASENDILWSGAIGCASEISPAANREPAGCANQAWSAATFLELLRELE